MLLLLPLPLPLLFLLWSLASAAIAASCICQGVTAISRSMSWLPRGLCASNKAFALSEVAVDVTVCTFQNIVTVQASTGHCACSHCAAVSPPLTTAIAVVKEGDKSVNPPNIQKT